MPAKTPQHVIDEAVRLYMEGRSSTEIAASLPVSASAVTRFARDAGVIRDQRQAKLAQYAVKPKPFGTVEPGKVYGAEGGVKICADCGSTFPADLDHFYKRTRSNGRVYLSSCCKTCVKKQRSGFRQEFPEKVLDANRRSYQRNGARHNETKREKLRNDPEKRAEAASKSKAWQKNNRDKVIAYRRARYLVFADQIAEANRKYQQANPEKYRTLRRNRKARVRGAGGSFTAEDIATRFQEQSGLCFWCKTDISSGYHADHFLPIAQGGTNHAYNIVLACPTCNLSRGKKLPADFFSYLKKIEGMSEEIMSRRKYLAQKMREHRDRLRSAQKS